MGIKSWLKKFLPLPIRWANSQYKQLTSKLSTIEQKVDAHEIEMQSIDTNVGLAKSHLIKIDSKLLGIDSKISDTSYLDNKYHELIIRLDNYNNNLCQSIDNQASLTGNYIHKISKQLNVMDSHINNTDHLDNIYQIFNAKLNNLENKIDINIDSANLVQNNFAEIQKVINNLTANSATLKKSLEILLSDGKTNRTTQTLFLTTFPHHRSSNVGDNLLCDSAMQLIYSKKPSMTSPILLFREEKLDDYPDGSIKTIIAPGFSVSNDVYPNLFRLYENLDRLPKFFPIGCSFQHDIPSHEVFDSYVYNEATSTFLKMLVKKNGPLPCRDRLITDMLIKNGISAVYSGDMGLYDIKKIGTPFIPPPKVNSIVFTIQHHSRYDAQSVYLLGLIKERFPKAKLYIAFHSTPNKRSIPIEKVAVSMGYTTLNLFGNVANLILYDSMDLHIGYRLHGHIYFLRQRKPSILMVEDARAFGFAKTKETSIGCFDALLETGTADELIPSQVMDFVETQIRDKFSDYKNIFSFIDSMYLDFIDPFFTRIARQID